MPYHANKGSFSKGNKGKPVGSVNKISQKVRESVLKFLEDNIDQVTEDYQSLGTAGERLAFIEKLLPYAIAKNQAVQMEHSGEVGLQITFKDAE